MRPRLRLIRPRLILRLMRMRRRLIRQRLRLRLMRLRLRLRLMRLRLRLSLRLRARTAKYFCGASKKIFGRDSNQRRFLSDLE